MGTKLMANHLGSTTRSISWVAGLVDAGRAGELKFRNKMVKIPEDVRSEWENDTFVGIISLETLDKEAADYDVNQGNGDWQVMVKYAPGRPKYFTVTSRVKSYSFAVDRLMKAQVFYLARINDDPGSLPPAMGQLVPYMRDPAYYVDKKGTRVEQGKKTYELSEEQRGKVLGVIANAFTILKGEGELRVRAMNVLANRFGVEIPAEALDAVRSEESSFPTPPTDPKKDEGSGYPGKPELKTEATDVGMGSGASSSGAENFVILEPTETVVKSEKGMKTFVSP
jgi:hypothetical protein